MLMSFLRGHDYTDVGARVPPEAVTAEFSMIMSACSGTLFDWMPEQIRHDGINDITKLTSLNY